VNDAAAALAANGILKHLSDSNLRHQECGADIEGDHVVQMWFGDIDERLRNIHPGVIQQNVQAVDAGEGGMHLFALGDIANDYARATARIADAFCDLFEFATRSAD